MAKTPRHSEAILLACVYAPATFAMNAFNFIEEKKLGQPTKDFPTFMKIYTNLLKSFSKIEKDWGTLSFKEFNEKFSDIFSKNGHYAFEIKEKYKDIH